MTTTQQCAVHQLLCHYIFVISFHFGFYDASQLMAIPYFPFILSPDVDRQLWHSALEQKNLLDNIYGHKFNYYCIKLCLRLTSTQKCCVTQFECPSCSHNTEAMITVFSHHKEIIQWMDDFLCRRHPSPVLCTYMWKISFHAQLNNNMYTQKGEVAEPFFRLTAMCQSNEWALIASEIEYEQIKLT